MGLWAMDALTSGMPDGHWLREHLLDSAAHTRLMNHGAGAAVGAALLAARPDPRG